MNSSEYKNRVVNALDRYRKLQSKKPKNIDAIDPGGPRPKRKKQRGTEHSEQAIVVKWLGLRGVLYCAVPNGAWLAGGKNQRMRQMAKLKAEGLKAGVPDLLVFTRPPTQPSAIGTALELKRIKGAKPSDAQLWWLERLGRLGWVCSVQYGADAAIEWLESLGY